MKGHKVLAGDKTNEQPASLMAALGAERAPGTRTAAQLSHLRNVAHALSPKCPLAPRPLQRDQGVVSPACPSLSGGCVYGLFGLAGNINANRGRATRDFSF